MLSDASVADDVGKHCAKRRNCSKQAVSLFSIMYSNYNCYSTTNNEDFLCVCLYKFTIVCC